MKSPVVKRSIVIAGHKTSVSLEDAFWKGLKEIAGGRDMTLSDLVSTIDSDRRHGNLSSAIRLFVLDYYRAQIPGHQPETGAPRPTRDAGRLTSERATRLNCHSAPAEWHPLIALFLSPADACFRRMPAPDLIRAGADSPIETCAWSSARPSA